MSKKKVAEGQLSFLFFASKKENEHSNKLSLSNDKDNRVQKGQLSLIEKEVSPVIVPEKQNNGAEIEPLSFDDSIQSEEEQNDSVDEEQKQSNPSGYENKFLSLDDKALEVIKKACSVYYFNKRFSFISLDNALSLEDMVSECVMKACVKKIFSKPMSERLLYNFVKQSFITRAIYQTRHFKDEMLKDQTYRNKCLHIEEETLQYGRDTERVAEEGERAQFIDKLSEYPILAGTIQLDGDYHICEKDIVKLIYAGYKPKEIVKAYKGYFCRNVVKDAVDSAFNDGARRLRRIYSSQQK